MDIIENLKRTTKWLPLIPVLTLNGTLALVEVVQRFFYFDKETDVGEVSQLFVDPIRSTKLMCVNAWDVKFIGFKNSKRIAVYETTPFIHRISCTTKKGCEMMNISSQWENEELVLAHKNLPGFKKHIETIKSGERIFGLKYKNEENDFVEYIKVGQDADDWISSIIGRPVILLYCPEVTMSGERNYPVYGSPNNKPAAVPPIHIVGQSTLDKMNAAANTNFEIQRFRPNIVNRYSKPGAEGFWKIIRIGEELELEQTFMNPRCSVLNSYDGMLNSKVLDTVYKHGPFRDLRNRPCFGSYWKVLRQGKVKIGDKITLLKAIDQEVTGPYSLSKDFVVG